MSGGRLDYKAERAYFFKQGLAIALPVMLQNLISIGLNIVDSLMIGGLGEAPLAAVGSANQIYLIYSEICFGMYSGAGVFVAQFWGIKDLKTIKKVLGIDYIVGVVSAIAAIILIQLMAPNIIGIFAEKQIVIDYGVEYIKIVSLSYLFSGLSFCILFNSRAVERLTVPTVISALAIGVNTLLNWAFIYGHMGFEPMGIKGAAFATLTARIIEAATLFVYVYIQKEHPLKANLKELLGFDANMVKDVFKMALPVSATEVGWGVCMALMFAAYGKISFQALAVVQVAEVVTCFFQCVYFGLGNAAAFVIGACLGRAELERSYYFAKLTMRITWILNVPLTTGLLLIRGTIVSFYKFTPETNQLLYISLAVWAFTMIPKMIGYVLICGILRCGGDTVFALKVDLSLNIIEVILAFVGVLILKFNLPQVVAFVYSAEIIKAILCYVRFYSKKWINVITDVSYD